MALYGIREILHGEVRPMSILAGTFFTGDAQERLSAGSRYLQADAGIMLTTFRKTLFLSEDLNFVVQLFLEGVAYDHEEYFEFKRDKIGNPTYEVYEAISQQRVDFDLNSPELAEAKSAIEHLRQMREERMAADD